MYDLDPTVQRVALNLINPFFAILSHPSFTTCSPVTGWGGRVETTALVRMLYHTINSAVEITTCDDDVLRLSNVRIDWRFVLQLEAGART